MPINLRDSTRKLLGLYELEIRKYVEAYVKPGACCYDLGSNSGYYTLAFTRLSSPGGEVYAVDGDPDFCKSLIETLSLNKQTSSKAHVLNYMIGDTVRETDKKVTLDHLVFEKGCRPPNVVKMDVEGSEYTVLLGARRVIHEFTPKFIIETHSKQLEDQCKSFLEGEKYKCTIVRNNKFLPELRPIPHNRWLCAEKL